MHAPAAARPRGWRAAWTPRRAVLWLSACAVAAYLPALGVPLRGWLDFSAFYAAGRLALTPDVARLAPVVEFQAANGLPITPFVYPAGVALAYVPFAWLPYPVAAALHLGLMLAALIAAAVIGARLLGLPRRWAVLGTLAWAPAAAGVVSGQNTPLALLLVVVAAKTLARADGGGEGSPNGGLSAGGAIGTLAYKPQLFAPLAGLLALRGRWLALAAAACVVAVHYGLGVVATGGNAAWPADWARTLMAYNAEDLRANGWQAVSLPALAARLELLLGVPWLSLVGYAAGAVVVAACVPALRRQPIVPAIALACAAGLVISPHAWVYDATLLLPALGVFAARARARGWPWQDRWLLAVAYGVALTWPLGGVLGFTLVLAVVIATPPALLGWGPFGRVGRIADRDGTGASLAV